MDLKKVQEDFMSLVRKQFATMDFDAEHPLYIYLVNKYKIDYVPGVWLSFLYMAFYDEASAWVVFNNSDPFTIPKRINLPIGTNRRNLFGGKINRHFESLAAVRKTAKSWPTHNFSGDVLKDWEILKDNLGEVWGNGRFAKYTTAEMLQKVNKLPVTVTGFDNKDSSGPADGIRRLFGCPDTIASLDEHAELTYANVLKSGARPSYTLVDRGVVESVLCNFSGVCRGRFYSGRNVDRQQQRIIRVEKLGEELIELWDARKDVFPEWSLGEVRGWNGIDKQRLTSYRDTGEILWTHRER